MTGYSWRIDDVLRAECDRLLDVLDVGNFTSIVRSVTFDETMCWLCNGVEPTTEIGLCGHCYAWVKFEHDETPKVYVWSMSGRHAVSRFGTPNPQFDPWIDPEIGAPGER